jgi:hypothetical protein
MKFFLANLIMLAGYSIKQKDHPPLLFPLVTKAITTRAIFGSAKIGG